MTAAAIDYPPKWKILPVCKKREKKEKEKKKKNKN